jgi:transposase
VESLDGSERATKQRVKANFRFNLIETKFHEVKFALSDGEVHDLMCAPQLISAFPKLRKLLADKAYNANYIDAQCAIRAIEVVIPPKSNAKNPRPYNAQTYKMRNAVERCFARLKMFRRVATRYDRKTYTYQATITIAAILSFWLNY